MTPLGESSIRREAKPGGMRIEIMNMASIQVDGEDKTAKISDWAIRWNDKYKALELTCHFPSKKKYTPKSLNT